MKLRYKILALMTGLAGVFNALTWSYIAEYGMKLSYEYGAWFFAGASLTLIFVAGQMYAEYSAGERIDFERKMKKKKNDNKPRNTGGMDYEV